MARMDLVNAFGALRGRISKPFLWQCWVPIKLRFERIGVGEGVIGFRVLKCRFRTRLLVNVFKRPGKQRGQKNASLLATFPSLRLEKFTQIFTFTFIHIHIHIHTDSHRYNATRQNIFLASNYSI